MDLRDVVFHRLEVREVDLDLIDACRSCFEAVGPDGTAGQRIARSDHAQNSVHDVPSGEVQGELTGQDVDRILLDVAPSYRGRKNAIGRSRGDLKILRHERGRKDELLSVVVKAVRYEIGGETPWYGERDFEETGDGIFVFLLAEASQDGAARFVVFKKYLTQPARYSINLLVRRLLLFFGGHLPTLQNFKNLPPGFG